MSFNPAHSDTTTELALEKEVLAPQNRNDDPTKIYYEGRKGRDQHFTLYLPHFKTLAQCRPTNPTETFCVK